MLKIGILGDAFIQWGGGLDFLRTICASLGATSTPMELHLLLPVSGPRATLHAAFQKLKVNAHAVTGKQVSSYAPSAEDIELAISGYDVPIVCHRIDPRYFRPTEVETLLGDPGKAKQKLGWVPEITAQEMCTEIVTHDLAQAKQHALLKANGYTVNVSVE